MKLKEYIQQCIATIAVVAICLSSLNAEAAWYTQKKVITHAAGEINGYKVTNSKEALLKSLSNKTSIIELDFMFTSDGQLVCSHGWEDAYGRNIKAPTYQEFRSAKVASQFTPLSASEAVFYLNKSPNVYLVVDTQEKNIKKVYTALLEICERQNCKDLFKRVIPQIYKESDYKAVRSVYKSKNMIYSLYKKKPKTNKDYKKIAKFCKSKKIKMVAINKKNVTTTVVKTFHKYGVKCSAHTVNSQKQYLDLQKKGIDLIYSDTIKP